MKLQIGVKVLLKNRAGLYLLIRRSQSLLDGTGAKWDIPGGRIRPGERLDEALAREVREEIDAMLNGEPVLLSAQDILLPAHDTHVVRLTYAAEIDGEIRLSHEHQSFKWVTPTEALTLDIDPYLRRVLEKLQ